MYLSKIISAMSKARKHQYMQKRYVHNLQRYTLLLDVINVQAYKVNIWWKSLYYRSLLDNVDA